MSQFVPLTLPYCQPIVSALWRRPARVVAIVSGAIAPRPSGRVAGGV